MDNIYPWKKYIHIERGRAWASQLCGATYDVSIGDKWDLDVIYGNNVLAYPGATSTHIRDGVQIKQCFVEIEIKNNSTINYIVDKYILKSRFDSSERVSTVCNHAFTNMVMLNQGLPAECSPLGFASGGGNWPPAVTLWDLPEATAHFKFKKSRFLFKVGEVLKFTLHPDRMENKIFNSAVLYGNDKVFKADKTKHCFMTFTGCMAHEYNPALPGFTGPTVRSEVEGIDIEQTWHYCARIIKEPIDVGNITKFSSPIVPDILNTTVGISNGAYVTLARDYPP